MRRLCALLTAFVLSGSLALHAQTPDARRLTREPTPGSAGRRLALVIGNDMYPNAPLVNARRDAAAVAAVLRELPEPFTVTVVQDATHAQMATAIGTFTEGLGPNDVAIFYYAGHGVAVDQENYLVPVDYAGTTIMEAKLRMLQASSIARAVSVARVGVVVLDACRNNPFLGRRNGTGGLAPMEARGTLIAYATGAGQTASDNPAGKNGLFTEAFVRALSEPGLTLSDLFRRVRQDVSAATNDQQRPAVYEDLNGDVVLRLGPRPTFPPAVRGRLLLEIDTDAQISVSGNDIGVVKKGEMRPVDVALGENLVIVKSVMGAVEERRSIMVADTRQQVVSFQLEARARDAARTSAINYARQRFERAVRERPRNWILDAQNQLNALRSMGAASEADVRTFQDAAAQVKVTVRFLNFEEDGRVNFAWMGQSYSLQGARSRMGDEVKLQMPLGANHVMMRIRNSYSRIDVTCDITILVTDPDEFYNEYKIETDDGCQGVKKERERR